MTTFSHRSSCHYLIFFVFLILLGLASTSSSATFISNDIFEAPHGSVGRSLLQAAKNCPVDFENQNYTIITSQCKGPNYPTTICCGALKKFACPFAEHVNDMKNDCATTMFSYINLYGKYPPGLFAFQCKENTEEGITCDEAPAPAPSKSTRAIAAPATHLAFAATVMLLSLNFF